MYTDAGVYLVLCSLRYYDPAVGRWLNRDPIGTAGGQNLYAYCDGNPVMRADPSGLQQLKSSPFGIPYKDGVATVYGGLITNDPRVIVNASRFDSSWSRYDEALQSALAKIGADGEEGLGAATVQRFNSIGQLISEQTAGLNARGFRIDGQDGHVNWWDWRGGKIGGGGRNGHEWFPEEQIPSVPHNDQPASSKVWESSGRTGFPESCEPVQAPVTEPVPVQVPVEAPVEADAEILFELIP